MFFTLAGVILGIGTDLVAIERLEGRLASALAEQVFERIGLFLFSRIIAELGTVATGTNYVAMILCDLCYYTAIGMGVASSAFTGQKLGEKRPDLAKIYGKVASNVGYIVSTFFAVIFILFRKASNIFYLNRNLYRPQCIPSSSL